MSLVAQGSVLVGALALTDTQLQDEYRKKKSTFSSKTTTKHSESTSTTAQGSTLSGGSIVITAGQNTEVKRTTASASL